MDSSRDRIVLLFCHGGSLNKQIWTPIVRRLKAAPALQRFAWQHFAIDWRYHGDESSDADPAKFYYQDGDKKLPRVEHPGRHWPEWAPQDLKKVTELLRNEDTALGRKTHIIGIGHSMGGASMLNVEVHHPGTFAGLILFEPMLAIDKAQEAADWVKSAAVTNTLRRQGEWDSWEEVVEHFRRSKIFRRWHPESLASYLESGIKKANDGKKFRLSLPLIQEAALYCHEVMVFAKDEIRRMQCNAVLEFGDHTQLYDISLAQEMIEEFPDLFTLAEPLEGKTHLLVVEDPDGCADHIATNLLKFPVIQNALSASRM